MQRPAFSSSKNWQNKVQRCIYNKSCSCHNLSAAKKFKPFQHQSRRVTQMLIDCSSTKPQTDDASTCEPNFYLCNQTFNQGSLKSWSHKSSVWDCSIKLDNEGRKGGKFLSQTGNHLINVNSNLDGLKERLNESKQPKLNY